jgi:two-component system, NarL family, nitrate/nitrite response regulator NarL
MRLVLCDDNRMMCEALGAALAARGHLVLATAATATLGIAAVRTHVPDACILGLRFPHAPDGLGAALLMRQRYPETAVLMLSGVTDPDALAKATRIGVAGFLRKDQNVDYIAEALHIIASGGVVFDSIQPRHSWSPGTRRYRPVSDLTSREAEVLRRIAAGQGTRQMSCEMNVAPSTLRTYVKNMLAKLGVHTRLEAAVLATRQDLLTDLIA